MERLFKHHWIKVDWDDDHQGFVVRCRDVDTNATTLTYIDYESYDRYEAMHKAKNRLAKQLNKVKQ